MSCNIVTRQRGGRGLDTRMFRTHGLSSHVFARVARNGKSVRVCERERERVGCAIEQTGLPSNLSGRAKEDLKRGCTRARNERGEPHSSQRFNLLLCSAFLFLSSASLKATVRDDACRGSSSRDWFIPVQVSF